MKGKQNCSLELQAKIAIVLCLTALSYFFLQAQKGSILHCLAKVLSLFEVSSVSDLMCLGTFFGDANAVYFDFLKKKNQPNALIFLKWPRNFCSHEFNLLVD